MTGSNSANFTPNFSLLHPTARTPNGWVEAWETWAERCVRPWMVEYILVADEGEDSTSVIEWIGSTDQDFNKLPIKFATNHGRRCTVDAWNLAARISKGKVLVSVADDWFPCPSWDRVLETAIGDRAECVVHPSCNFQPELMTHPILTRQYYERPGRGGCPNGELLYPEYISVGSDDDFTEYAKRDGVVVRIPQKFVHRHRAIDPSLDDDTYRRSNRQEAWDEKERVIGRRRRENYSR